ncbi:MAG: hypothetical protein AAB922_03215 [Patescibacteria group bacterium]
MPRKRSPEQLKRIWNEHIAGATYKEIGEKYTVVGKNAKTTNNLVKISTENGKAIIDSYGMQKIKGDFVNDERFRREKVLKTIDILIDDKNPHIKAKGAELGGKTLAMFTDKVQMDATTRNMDVYIDYTE